jgi:hypothetical protein
MVAAIFTSLGGRFAAVALPRRTSPNNWGAGPWRRGGGGSIIVRGRAKRVSRWFA